MTRILLKLALVVSVAWLASPSDVFAGRGGGSRGGGGGGYGGGSHGGGMGGNPSFSQPHPPMNESRPPGGSENGHSPTTGSRSSYGNSSESAARPPSGNPSSYPNRNQSPSNAGAAAAGAGAANRNQQPTHSNAGAAAAGAGVANRNQQPNVSNAGAAAVGAGAANRNQQPKVSNAGAAATGAGVANRNQQPNLSNAGAAAAGAGVANRNQQPNLSNAGAAAAGAGYANRNQQPNLSNAGAAAAGAGYANRNQPNYPNAGAAAVGAGYANRNQYNQYHPGMVNGYWNGNNSAAWGATGAGLGAMIGVGAWGTGSPMYSYGYSSYNNPYAGVPAGAVGGLQQAGNAPQQGGAAAYNYSQPISTTAAPPEPTVADQATAAFDQAREAFKAGDYANALQLDQQALTQMPNDTTLHEFLALVLFAQGKYEQAAAPLYAVLSVGPGWDWTTLSGMYADVATYTGQLRNLETYIDANPRSAQARFVLAYQYLSEGHDDNAVAQLKQVVKLQPGDTLSAQLIARSQPAGSTPPASTESVPAAAPVLEGKLSGRWTATPAKDASIALSIQDDSRFTWGASGSGKPPVTITGTSTLADGVLTLADEKGQNGALAGKVVWKDADHFNFRLNGAAPTDPGLDFGR